MKRRGIIILMCIFISIFVVLVIFNRGITGKFVFDDDTFPGVYVDFGVEYKNKSEKAGAAVVGKSGEFWNTVYVPESKFTYYQLRYANGDQSNIGIQLINLDSASRMKFRAAVNDEMFDSFNYASGNAQVKISNLKEGIFDIYIYGNDGINRGNFSLRVEREGLSYDYGNKVVKEGEQVFEYIDWIENVHFVKFSNIPIIKGDLLEVYINNFDDNDSSNIAFIQGMQIVRSNTERNIKSIELPGTTIEIEKEQCADTDNGLNYNLLGYVYSTKDENKTDNCLNEDELEEFYCLNGTMRSDVYKCANGCFEGRCFSLRELGDNSNLRVTLVGIVCSVSGIFDGQEYDECMYEAFEK